MNWCAASYLNHDHALLLQDPSQLDRLNAIFEQDWSLAGGSPTPLPSFVGPVERATPGSGIRALLTSRVAPARTRIAAEVFDLTDPPVPKGLAG